MIEIKTTKEIIKEDIILGYTFDTNDEHESHIKPYARCEDDKEWISKDSLLKLKDKLRKALIINSKCDCMISTTKFADIVDVLLWFEIKKLTTQTN